MRELSQIRQVVSKVEKKSHKRNTIFTRKSNKQGFTLIDTKYIMRL